MQKKGDRVGYGSRIRSTLSLDDSQLVLQILVRIAVRDVLFLNCLSPNVVIMKPGSDSLKAVVLPMFRSCVADSRQFPISFLPSVSKSALLRSPTHPLDSLERHFARDLEKHTNEQADKYAMECPESALGIIAGAAAFSVSFRGTCHL